MSPAWRGKSQESPGNLWWLAGSMILIGWYCLAWPEAPLSDPYWDRLPNRTSFGYALGAIFLGGGVLFLCHGLAGLDRFRRPAHVGETVGGFLMVGGFAYVFWTLMTL